MSFYECVENVGCTISSDIGTYHKESCPIYCQFSSKKMSFYECVENVGCTISSDI